MTKGPRSNGNSKARYIAEQFQDNKSLIRYSLISLSVVLFVFLVILPLTSMFQFAFEDGPGAFFDSVASKTARLSFRNSMLLAVLTTLVNLFVGSLIAYTITRYHFPGRAILKALIDLPIAIPAAVVGLAMMMLYGPLGVLAGMGLLESQELVMWGTDVFIISPGILLAHIFVTFPFMVRSVAVSVEKLDLSQDEAALTLGASRLQTFLHVTLPSLRGGLIAGTALTFTRSLGEFGATLFLAGGMVKTAPIYIYYVSDSQFDFQAATSVALILMIFPFALLLILNYIAERLEAK